MGINSPVIPHLRRTKPSKQRNLSDPLPTTRILASVHRNLISDHRLARLLTWARLWLVWALSVLGALCGDWLREELDYIARGVVSVLVIKAAKRARPSKRGRHLRPLHAPRGFRMRAHMSAGRRRFLGARIRRALAGRDGSARIAAIQRMLREAERWIAYLARRFGRLTRMRPIVLVAPPAFACADAAPARGPAFANTS